MKTLFLKSLATVSLSFLLLYSGVAWAFYNCFENAEEHERATDSEPSITSREAAISLPASSLKPDWHPFAKIHCSVSHFQTSPVLQMSSRSSLTSIRKLLSKTSLAGSAARETNPLWLNPLFEWYALIFSSSGVARHLFLSVFKI